MNLPDLKGIILASSAFFLVILLSGGLWWWINRSLDKINEENSNLAMLRDDISQRAKVLSLTEETADARRKVDQYFVNPNTLAGFIEQVEVTAQNTGAKLTINQATAKDNVFLELYVEGTFSELMNFIHLIETMPFHIQITKLSLVQNSIQDKQKYITWSAAVSLTLISFEK